ncbi:MAG: DNA circularization N-terminal domain-containing protein [Nitrosomonadales bacterium]|nr:DNA circularization N-terminal domain-containing protein [Nitrosomonadales bacterium]
MAWSQTLQDASFKGIVFEVVKTDDSSERAIAEHTYPYVDGSDIEDMGRGARRISVEAVFYGDDYETRLQKFLAVLDQAGAGEFIHPVFGSIKNAQAARSSVHHDAESPDYASVPVEFIESTPGNPFFDRSLPSQMADAVQQHGVLATASASAAAAALIERLSAANPLAGLDALRDTLTAPLLAIAAQTGVVLSGLDVLAYPRAWGNDIAALVDGILDVRDFGSRLAADWASIQSDLNAFSIFSAPPSTATVPAPAQITSGSVPTEAQAIAATSATIQVNTAVGLANAASYVLASEAATPTLSPVEIEAICNKARIALDVAIEQVRAIYGIEQSRTITEPLKDQGLAVQEAARSIIEARPPLMLRTVEAPGNFRLLAHLWYADHTRAAELFRLNGARSPFVEVGDRVHAYAS